MEECFYKCLILESLKLGAVTGFLKEPEYPNHLMIKTKLFDGGKLIVLTDIWIDIGCQDNFFLPCTYN